MLGELAQTGAQIAGVAAGLAGVGYLARKGWIGGRLLARVSKALARLGKLGDEDAWPNGSTDAVTFLSHLHNWMESIDNMLRTHLVDHQQLEVDETRGTRQWDEPSGTAV